MRGGCCTLLLHQLSFKRQKQKRLDPCPRVRYGVWFPDGPRVGRQIPASAPALPLRRPELPGLGHPRRWVPVQWHSDRGCHARLADVDAALTRIPFQARNPCPARRRPGAGTMRKLTWVLVATINGPSGTSSRHQASSRPQSARFTTTSRGSVTAFLRRYAGTAARSGNLGSAERPSAGAGVAAVGAAAGVRSAARAGSGRRWPGTREDPSA